MNLHSVVSGAIAAVNPPHQVTLRRGAGYITNSDFSRVPQYTTEVATAQVQPLQFSDIVTLNGVGITGVRRKLYLWGSAHGLLRSLQLGNDVVIFPDASVWKIAFLFEAFGHALVGATGWCSVAVTLQNPASEGGAAIAMPAGAPFNAGGRLNG